MRTRFQLFDRREFLNAAGKIGVAFSLIGASSKSSSTSSGATNPFSYDLSQAAKTDPALIKYETAGKWKAGRKEPSRVAIGNDQRLYVCAGNYLTAYSLGGEQLLELALPAAATCVAAGGDGTVFAGTRDHIEVFDATGKRAATWESAGRKSWLTGLAAAGNDVFAADSGNRVILRYDRSGKMNGRIGEKNAERNVPGFVVPSPYLGVAIHADGLLRVNNPGRHQVEAFTCGGDFEGAWGKPSAAIEGFCGCCNPVALALLPDGRIVTAEKGLPRVKVYSASGEFECVVAGPELFPENARACSDLNDCTHGGLNVAADQAGNIYIVDRVTQGVRVMKPKT